MSDIIAQHDVPGTDLEIIIRKWYLGATHGYRYGVAAYEKRNTKLEWRQRGSEEVFTDEAAARTRANEMWLSWKGE